MSNELEDAKQRIRELETELEEERRTNRILRNCVPGKSRPHAAVALPSIEIRTDGAPQTKSGGK